MLTDLSSHPDLYHFTLRLENEYQVDDFTSLGNLLLPSPKLVVSFYGQGAILGIQSNGPKQSKAEGPF